MGKYLYNSKYSVEWGINGSLQITVTLTFHEAVNAAETAQGSSKEAKLGARSSRQTQWSKPPREYRINESNSKKLDEAVKRQWRGRGSSVDGAAAAGKAAAKAAAAEIKAAAETKAAAAAKAETKAETKADEDRLRYFVPYFEKHYTIDRPLDLVKISPPCADNKAKRQIVMKLTPKTPPEGALPAETAAEEKAEAQAETAVMVLPNQKIMEDMIYRAHRQMLMDEMLERCDQRLAKKSYLHHYADLYHRLIAKRCERLRIENAVNLFDTKVWQVLSNPSWDMPKDEPCVEVEIKKHFDEAIKIGEEKENEETIEIEKKEEKERGLVNEEKIQEKLRRSRTSQESSKEAELDTRSSRQTRRSKSLSKYRIKKSAANRLDAAAKDHRRGQSSRVDAAAGGNTGAHLEGDTSVLINPCRDNQNPVQYGGVGGVENWFRENTLEGNLPTVEELELMNCGSGENGIPSVSHD